MENWVYTASAARLDFGRGSFWLEDGYCVVSWKSIKSCGWPQPEKQWFSECEFWQWFWRQTAQKWAYRFLNKRVKITKVLLLRWALQARPRHSLVWRRPPILRLPQKQKAYKPATTVPNLNFRTAQNPTISPNMWKTDAHEPIQQMEPNFKILLAQPFRRVFETRIRKHNQQSTQGPTIRRHTANNRKSRVQNVGGNHHRYGNKQI